MNPIAKIGYVEGICPRCDKTLRRRRPADYAVCDCSKECPLCGKEMQPYTPKMDLTPSTYDPLDIESASGDLDNPMEILCYCPNCKHYSALRPVEVKLE